MATLRIEHPITDFTAWQSAFGRLSSARADGGVLSARVYRPVDDPKFVFIDLDFGTVDEAQAFREFLYRKVWSSPDRAPALAGAALTRIVEAAPMHPGVAGLPAAVPHGARLTGPATACSPIRGRVEHARGSGRRAP